MAVFLSISSTSTATPLISSAKQKHPFLKSHKPSIYFIPQSSPKINHLSISDSFSPPPLPLPLLHNPHDFRCCFSFQEHSSNIMDEGMVEEGEEREERGAKKMWESVETLTKYYKEAIFSGDYQTITEIESVLLRLETEKNKLEEKLSTLTEEITSGKEKFIRLQADFDNFRRRSEKERLSVRSNAQGEVIESLLPMVDSFERAKQQIKPETDKEKQIDTSYQGIYKQFVEIMRSLRVSVVATVGKPFDPSLHEAIAREESEEFKEGIIIQEFRRGFILGDQLLRPAMVKVSSGPGKKKGKAATQISLEQPAVTAAGVDEH